MAEKPRCDLDAEAAVLSAALLWPDAALEALEILGPGDFYSDANRHVFTAILAVVAENSGCDVVAVSARLRATGRLEQIGGTPYLGQLADATPAVANVAQHARVIKNLARIRRAGSVFAQLAAEARTADIEDADAWLESCEARACAATLERGRADTAADYHVLSGAVYDRIYSASKRSDVVLGRSSGFQKLDEHILGFMPGELVIIAGRPGQGKTALALQITEAMTRDARDPCAGVIFSLEMTKEQLMERSMCRVSGESSRLLRVGKPENWSRVTEAAASLGRLPIIVDDESGMSALRLRAKLRRHRATLRSKDPNLKLGVIMVDYLQLMRADHTSKRHQTRTEEIGDITGTLKQLAKETGCVVIALSQFRRPDRKGNEIPPPPQLSDLKDSGAIEQDADTVIAIHREDQYRLDKKSRDGRTELLILKARKAEEGMHLVKFHGDRTMFTDDYVEPPTERYQRGRNGNGHYTSEPEEIGSNGTIF